MTDPVEEEFCYRIKIALKAYGKSRVTTGKIVVRTCVTEGIYISDREGMLRAHIYMTKEKGWMVPGREFTKIFEESEDGIYALHGAIQALLPKLRKLQVLDDLAGL